jgi:hypothetical protein
LTKFEGGIPAGRLYGNDVDTAFILEMKKPAAAAKKKLEKYFCKPNYTDNMHMCLVLDPAVKMTWFASNGYTSLEIEGITKRYVFV